VDLDGRMLRADDRHRHPDCARFLGLSLVAFKNLQWLKTPVTLIGRSLGRSPPLASVALEAVKIPGQIIALDRYASRSNAEAPVHGREI
jgi:hypothetical protein